MPYVQAPYLCMTVVKKACNVQRITSHHGLRLNAAIDIVQYSIVLLLRPCSKLP